MLINTIYCQSDYAGRVHRLNRDSRTKEDTCGNPTFKGKTQRRRYIRDSWQKLEADKRWVMFFT